MELKTTPLFAEHERLGAKCAPFGGWLMPIQYEGIIAEHLWTRHNCSLFDICHMGEFFISGTPRNSGLEKIIPSNLDTLSVGDCRYGFLLDEKGGIIDDVIVYKIEEERWLLVVNAATIDSDEAHLRKYLSASAHLENASARLAKLDVQGPLARSVVGKLVGTIADRLRYYSFDSVSLLGEECLVSRTGYTGELGFELYISSHNVPALWQLLLKDNRVKPAGLGARDTLRLEAGLPLYGQDVTSDFTPFEAGLERFIDFSKDFIGKDALSAKKKLPLTRQFTYFMTDSRRAPRHTYKIYCAEKEKGFVTSGSFAPSLGCGIGMGYVAPACTTPDTAIEIKEGPVVIPARIVKKPFYKKGSVRL